MATGLPLSRALCLLTVLLGCLHQAFGQQPPNYANSAVSVFTPTGLRDAVEGGAQHIVVEQHLDLLELGPSTGTDALLRLRATTLSIRGNCTEAGNPPDISGPDYIQGKSRQCVILSPSSLFILADRGQRIWLDALYLRFKPVLGAQPSDHFLLTTVEGSQAQVWLSALTFQGAIGHNVHGVYAGDPGGKVYGEDISFDSLSGPAGPGVTTYGAFSLHRASFKGTNATAEPGGSVIRLASPSAGVSLFAVPASGFGSGHFIEAPAGQPNVFTDSRGVDFVASGTGAPMSTQVLGAAPKGAFLTETDSWLQQTIADAPSLSPESTMVIRTADARDDIGGDDDSSSLPLIIIGACVLALIILLVGCCALWLRRRAVRRGRGGALGSQPGTPDKNPFTPHGADAVPRKTPRGDGLSATLEEGGASHYSGHLNREVTQPSLARA